MLALSQREAEIFHGAGIEYGSHAMNSGPDEEGIETSLTLVAGHGFQQDAKSVLASLLHFGMR